MNESSRFSFSDIVSRVNAFGMRRGYSPSMSNAVRAAIVAPVIARRPGKRIEITAHEVALLRAIASKGAK